MQSFCYSFVLSLNTREVSHILHTPEHEKLCSKARIINTRLSEKSTVEHYWCSLFKSIFGSKQLTVDGDSNQDERDKNVADVQDDQRVLRAREPTTHFRKL